MTDLATFLTARLDEQAAALADYIETRRRAKATDAFSHDYGILGTLQQVLAPSHPADFRRYLAPYELDAAIWLGADIAAKQAIVAEHAIMYRYIGWLEDGEEQGSELPVCGRCVPKHSHYRSRADVAEGACLTVRHLASAYTGHADYRASWTPR